MTAERERSEAREKKDASAEMLDLSTLYFPISIFEFPFFSRHGILARLPFFAEAAHRFPQTHRHFVHALHYKVTTVLARTILEIASPSILKAAIGM